MTWLIWRQSRAEVLIGCVIFGLVAAWVFWTGLEMRSSFDELGLATCMTADPPDGACRFAVDTFLRRFNVFEGMMIVPPLLLPFLIGMLLAAPTVQDFEQGTYRLVWTQGITRRRWLLFKVGIGVAGAVIGSIFLVAMWVWWRAPLDRINGHFDGGAFDFEGAVPIAYTIFAFSLCLMIGTLLRRSLPALSVGFAVFVAIRALVAEFFRPRYLDPVNVTWSPLDSAPAAVAAQQIASRDWIISDRYVDISGDLLSSGNSAIRECAAETGSTAAMAFERCLADHGVLNSVVYHPASRFVLFQGIETVFFLGIAVIFLAITAWWVLRRLD